MSFITTAERYELPAIRNVLDVLQQRADSLVFSRENMVPTETRSDSTEASMIKLFGRRALSHNLVDAVLKEVHPNYMALAREVLQVDPCSIGTEELSIPED